MLKKKLKVKKQKSSKDRRKFIEICIAGLPNAGKSTIINSLAGDKVSIISPKAQTTRDIIRGVFIENNTQVVLIDTPGIFVPKKKRLLERKIIKNAWRGVEQTDIICIVIDSTMGINKAIKTTIESILKKDKKIIFVLNKIDSIKKENLLQMASELEKIYPKFERIFMVSAKNGENMDIFKNYLISIAQKGDWMFNDDEITDAPMRFMAAEITREKLFLNLREDLPYSIDVVTDNWEEFNSGSLKINQTIKVLKESQKSIIIGKNGKMLKNISITSRKEMELFFGRKVHLFLFVQVRNDWIDGF